jgi:dTDP-4-dehydrorhamnose reductase
MRVLVLGAEGQVGAALVRQAAAAGHPTLGCNRAQVDVTDGAALRRAIADHGATHVFNAAAYNAVDAAEDEWDRAFRVNGVAPALVALAARDAGAAMLHYSTDHVFDGRQQAAYVETDTPHPLSEYGRSKWLGEQAVLAVHPAAWVLRTAWVFGRGRGSFVARVLEAARAGRELRFVDDAWSTPTWAEDLAAASLEVAARGLPGGLYHATGGPPCTPCDWARAVLDRAGSGATVMPIAARDYGGRAPRPARSVLDPSRLRSFGIALPGGLERLAAFFEAGGP